MKPTKLILCGWGPYRDKQEIDFEKLDNRGLFLITGATGAGKTTIFDAITYALYGSMSGNVREKNSVRSDFAKENTPTYVELFMTHGGEAYHIYRNPEYMRPKKRKTGAEDMTKEKEHAYLTLPSGEKVEGSSEVSRKMQELLRLDYRQFKQLSLIAQGEFAKLLTATSSEKSRIFREIFDTDLYDKMAGELRSRSSLLYKQVMEYRHKMEEDISFLKPAEKHKAEWEKLTGTGSYYYDAILKFLRDAGEETEKECEVLKEENTQAEKKVEALTVQVTEEEKIKSLYEKKKKELLRREDFFKKTKQITEKEEQIKKCEKAMEVQAFEQTYKAEKRQVEESEDKIKAFEAEVEELQKRQQDEKQFVINIPMLEDAYEEENLFKELEKQREDLKKQLLEQEKELEKLQGEYLSAEKSEEKAKADYEQADKKYRHGIAGILAKDLLENSPCPVCGSQVHPNKAKISQAMPTKQEVEKKKQIYEKLQKESRQVHEKTVACRERGTVLIENLAEIKKDLWAYGVKKEKRENFVKEYLTNYSNIHFLKQKKESETLTVRIQEKLQSLTKQKEELEQKKIVQSQTEEEFKKVRSEKGFVEEEEYRQAFLPEQILGAMRTEVAKYKEEFRANEQLLQHLEQELKGRKPKDIGILVKELDDKKIKRDAIREELSKKRHYAQDIDRLFNSLSDKQKKQQKLEEQYGIIKKLDDTASGNNRLRLIFEQYVLAAYFEEILKAANIRLKVMSTGRYELRRAQSVSDGRSKDYLEMEVMDYYTGKYRSVKTLSGGESFKTSLALALGMSDVVQALSGGVRVEALFIDEGFGSLDSESLEQACLTLQSLVEKDRLIGIISHVPELSEKIRDKIRIHKTNVGSRIEVMVS